MELFWKLFVDFIGDIVFLFDQTLIPVGTLKVSLLSLLLVPIAIGAFIRVFWKGEKS